MKRSITQADIEGFIRRLVEDERSGKTLEKYRRDVSAFYLWLPRDKVVDKALVMRYKAHIVGQYAASSVNSMLTAINRFLQFLGRGDCVVKTLKFQRSLYCRQERELTKPEYLRLLEASKKKGNLRLNLVMQSICATGIRVSELCFITVEAAQRRRAVVDCKGKIRMVFLPEQLCRALLGYAKAKGLVTGPVFVTEGGKPLDRGNIWADMKRLCRSAGVAREKVYPHNLRHLFARTFYRVEKDLARLADVLGHSSIETTRIYIISTGNEHEKTVQRLGLVV